MSALKQSILAMPYPRVEHCKSCKQALPQLDGLTATEFRMVKMAASGMENHEIAEELGVKLGTVRNNLSRAFDKLGKRNRVELLLWCVERIQEGKR